MTCHRKGMRVSRRASRVPRQYIFFRSASLGTPPFFLSIKEASAPRKTSCQRRPSVITKMTCSVLCLTGTCAWRRWVEQRTENREQRTENREQRTENREQRRRVQEEHHGNRSPRRFSLG